MAAARDRLGRGCRESRGDRSESSKPRAARRSQRSARCARQNVVTATIVAFAAFAFAFVAAVTWPVADSGDVTLTCSNAAQVTADAKLTIYAAPTSTWSTEISINGADTPTEGCVAVRTAVDANELSTFYAESGSTGYDYVKFCGSGGTDEIDAFATSHSALDGTQTTLISDINTAETTYGTTLAANYATNETAIGDIEDDLAAVEATTSTSTFITYSNTNNPSPTADGSCSESFKLTWNVSIHVTSPKERNSSPAQRTPSPENDAARGDCGSPRTRESVASNVIEPMWCRAGFVGDANPADIDRSSKPLLFPTVDGWGFTAFIDVERGRVRALGGVVKFGTANANGFVDARLVDATAMTCRRDVVLVALADGSTRAFHFDTDDATRDESIETISRRMCDDVIKEVGLDDDGAVYALDAAGTVWRARSFGVEKPERAFGEARVQTFAIGPRHGVFVTDAGEAHAFGWNLYGSCGLGDAFGDFVAKPTVIESLRRVDVRVSSASCGDAFTLLLSTDGSLYATGSNSDGQLGVHDSDVPRGAATRTPTLVDPPNGIGAFVSVRCGARHASALADDGAVYLWGSDDHAQLTGWNEHRNSTDDIVVTIHPPFTRVAPSVGRRVIVHHACGRAHVSIFIDDVDP